MSSFRLNTRTLFVAIVVAVMAMLTDAAEAKKWGKHKGHSHGWMEPCSDGWWARIRENRQANDDNRAVLRCLLNNCGWEVKKCAHDWQCRKTARCLSDCDGDRACAFQCIKTYDGLENDNVKSLGKCAMSNDCAQNSA